MQEVKGSAPIGHIQKNFSKPIDQDICTQSALSWKIVVSEKQSVTAVSLSVGGGVHLIKLTKLYMCTQKHDKDGHTEPGVHGHGSVPLSHLRNVITRIGLQQLLSWGHNKRAISTYCVSSPSISSSTSGILWASISARLRSSD